MEYSKNLKKCLELVDTEEIIELTRKLIAINSCPPLYQERNVAVEASKKFLEYGIPFQIDDLENLPSGGINRANLRASTGGEGYPHLLLSGHFDTVPPTDVLWKHNPFEAVVKDGKIYGRGATDMKSGDAAMIMAMCYIKKAEIPLRGKLSFLGTAGEEVGLDGAKAYVNTFGVDDIDAVIVGEASNGNMSVAQTGALWLKFETRGTSAHSGVAWKGVNALDNMLEFLSEFKKCDFEFEPHPLLGNPLFNINTISAGNAINIVPNHCLCQIDIRTVPGMSKEVILDKIDRIIQTCQRNPKFNIIYEVISESPPTETKLDNAICQAAFAANNAVFQQKILPDGTFFGTDSCVMRKKDGTLLPYIIYGPGNPENNHKVDEHVEIKQLINSVKFYIAIILQYLL